MSERKGRQRLAVIGSSCAGKSTFARNLSELWDIPHVQLDALHWGPNWTPVPSEELRAAVDAATQGERWVIDGNYNSIRNLIWPRADTVIWLNYSFPTVWRRALIRTFSRAWNQEELYSGNRETFRKALFSSDSILLWILQTYRRHRREFPQEFAQPQHAHLEVLEFRKPAQAAAFLEQVARSV